MPKPEVNNPSPELVLALKNRTQLSKAIEKQHKRFKEATGSRRRHFDREVEGLEKRLRKASSLVGSMLKDEGFPEDYELPGDD